MVGEHAINAFFGGHSAQAAVAVTPGPLAAIQVFPADATVTAGAVQSYSTAGFDAYGNSLGPVTASYIITWGTCTEASCLATGAGTVISGNTVNGVLIRSDAEDAADNLVQGNLIGTDETASFAVPNGASGVVLVSFDGSPGFTGQNVIGGADGLSQELRDQADMSLSFGKMVWPHMLARVMLAEQLYRAASILGGSPYHRA